MSSYAYKCVICGKQFKSRYDLGARPICPGCSTGSNLFRCIDCKATFYNPDPEGNFTDKCPFCKKINIERIEKPSEAEERAAVWRALIKMGFIRKLESDEYVMIPKHSVQAIREAREKVFKKGMFEGESREDFLNDSLKYLDNLIQWENTPNQTIRDVLKEYRREIQKEFGSLSRKIGLSFKSYARVVAFILDKLDSEHIVNFNDDSTIKLKIIKYVEHPDNHFINPKTGKTQSGKKVYQIFRCEFAKDTDEDLKIKFKTDYDYAMKLYKQMYENN